MSTAPVKVGTDGLVKMMRERYPAPDWALFLEVPRSTGFSSTAGYCDAVAMSLYPSRGLELNGFELKVSRSDWRKELAQPAKAETLFGYCDRWWVVFGDKTIPMDGEVPVTWGILAPRADGKLGVVKQAPELTPKPMDRGLVAALVRRAHQAAEGSIAARVHAEMKDATDRHARERAQLQDHGKEEAARLLKLIADFEQASGVSLRRAWEGPEKIGAAVKLLLHNGLDAQADSARQALGRVNQIREGLLQLIELLPKEPPA